MKKQAARVLGWPLLASLALVALAATVEGSRYTDTLTGMSGLTSYWNLNETSGTTAADQVTGDLIDGNNTGTYSGSGITVGTAGMRPTSGFFGFDETNNAATFSNYYEDILTMASAAGYGGSSDVTLLGWMRVAEPLPVSAHFGGLERNTASSRYIFATHQYGPPDDSTFKNMRPRTYVVDSLAMESSVANQVSLPNDQNWHFIVMTLSGAKTLSCYVDGLLKDADNLPDGLVGLAAPTHLVFGHDIGDADRGLNGQLDELAIFNRALSATEVKQLWTAAKLPMPGTIATAPYRQTSQNLGGLRNYWQFSETSGTTAADSVAGNDGTYVQLPSQPFPVSLGQDGPNAAGGYVGMPAGNTSVRFVWPDSENYMEIENSARIGDPVTGPAFADGISALTMSLWFKNSYDGEGYIAGFERSGETDRYVFAIHNWNGEAVRFYALADNGVQLGSGTITIDPVGEYSWHHLVQVWDGAEKRLRGYVDGMEVYNATDETMTSNLYVPEGFFVGRDQLGNTRPLGGFVDELALYDRALSAAEVLELYDSAFVATPAVPGDATRDGLVNQADADRLAENWGATALNSAYLTWWAMGDFNNAHVVNAADAAILTANWGYGVTESAAGVPEPGAITILASALAAMAFRNRTAPVRKRPGA